MKKSNLILASILFFISISCKKTLDFNKIEPVNSGDYSQPISDEKEWFEKKYNDFKTRYTDNNKKTLLWEKSYYHNFEFGRALVVPILFDQNYSVSFIKNKQSNQQNPKTTLPLNSLNYLLIKNDLNNQYTDELVNIIPEENYIVKLQNKKGDVAFDGMIQITDWNNNFKKGYFVENGKIKGNTIDKKSKALLIDCYETSYYLCPPENLSSSGEVINYAGCSYLYSSSNCFSIGSSSDGGGSYSDVLGYYYYENPVEKTRKLVAKVPNAYKQLNYCVQFSNALKKSMIQNNIAGKLLQVRTIVSNQNIYYQQLNSNISTNGFHQAILVGDTVFDNMNPNGVDYNFWVSNLVSGQGHNITSEDF